MMQEATREPAGQPVTTTTQVEAPSQPPTTTAANDITTITTESPPALVATAIDSLQPPPESTTVEAPTSSAIGPATTNPEEVVARATVATPQTAMTDSQTPQPVDGLLPAAIVETSTQLNNDEPENALTKKFTAAESAALKEFRGQLSDIFVEAYPDEPKAREIPVVMWGVTLDPRNPMKDARVSVVLMKFLRARNLSVPEAREMLLNTLRWREEWNIKSILEEEFPKEVFGRLGHIFGHDKDARPIVYNIYGGNTKAAFEDVQIFLRWRVALMEKSVALLDFNEVDQQIQIHDYAGASITGRDSNSKAAATEATNIFQSHYPEMLYKKFFINVPTFLTWIFWAFKPLISAKTLAKMTIVGSGKSTLRKALLPYIDEKEIPDKYGGAAINAF